MSAGVKDEVPTPRRKGTALFYYFLNLPLPGRDPTAYLVSYP